MLKRIAPLVHHSSSTRLRRVLVASVYALAMFAMTSSSIGCGDGYPDRVPVSGQVLIDGRPLTHGFVRFTPREGRPSYGTLDENGRFTLSCFDTNDGAIVGVHQIEVGSQEWIKDNEVLWHAPKKYIDRSTSGLTQEIKEPTDSLVINLTWDGGKPFREPYISATSSEAGSYK